MNVTGIDPLRRKLEKLKGPAIKRVARKGVTAGTKRINRGAKGRAPVETKTLKKSIGQKVKVYRGSGAAVGLVGPRAKYRQVVTVKGKPQLRDPRKYAHLAEIHTPFLKATLEEEKAGIEAEVARESKKALEAELRR